MAQDLKERSVSDPWGLVGTEVSSSHCRGKKAEIINYDHTGWQQARCGCGETYVHDEGAYKTTERTPERLLILLAES